MQHWEHRAEELAIVRVKCAGHWPRAAASIAVWQQDRVLLVQRGKPPVQGLWSLPGGHIEPGERAADAALRELGEETGVRAKLVGPVTTHDVIIHDDAGNLSAHYVIAVFCGRWLSGAPLAATDAKAAGFFARPELVNLAMTDQGRAIVDLAWEAYRAQQTD